LPEQVWSSLDKQGLGAVLSAIVAKVSVKDGTRSRMNRVSAWFTPKMKPRENTTQSQGGLQDALGTEYWNITVGTPDLDDSDEQHTTDATKRVTVVK
jgi:hypothetical protein